MTILLARCTSRSMAALPIRGLAKIIGHSLKSRFNAE